MTSKENSVMLFIAMKLASLFYREDNINFYIPISLVKYLYNKVDENF